MDGTSKTPRARRDESTPTTQPRGTLRCILLRTELPICDDKSPDVCVYPSSHAYPEEYPPVTQSDNILESMVAGH
ncbi:hypothetical protein F511_02475 [Dorcoceras hygrometricum]|uniref:Uncharacterized protein n=1 Tax=Dorcoceras hygrometricum TaxID=472368 RepID=A0A2Z6ZXI2_9LAMI|nr:hypothetical protein F511_44712 [Dorcoceras hygrometricum]KZV27366.1 hypothetical protein F511_02475 [Dorcoceras hygrometricum]